MYTASESSAALASHGAAIASDWDAPTDFGPDGPSGDFGPDGPSGDFGPDGPSGAFRGVYDEHAGFVWTNLRRLGVPMSELEDALQEVFVTAHRRASSYRPDASMRGWLYAILRRIAWRHRRSNARRGRLHDAIANAPKPVADPERKLAGRQAAALVDGFLADLDAKHRDVFVLAELEQMTAREISETLGVKPNTVSSRLRAARQAFDGHFARLRAEDRRVALSREALISARTRRVPPESAKARVLGALAMPLAAPAPMKLLPWLSAAMLGHAKAFAITVAIGLAALAAIGVATTPSRTAAVASAPTPMSSERTPSPTPASRAAIAPAVPRAAIATPPVESAAIAPEPPRTSPRRADPRAIASPRVATEPTPAPSPASTLGPEAALLLEIQAARDRGNPARALRLADQHARQFPNGALTQERRALRLTALCALGRDAQAQREAVALLRDQPSSALASRLATGCPRDEG